MPSSFAAGHLVEHLAEPVHRQNDAIKVGNSASQQSSTASTTSVTQTTKLLSQTSTTVVIKPDIIFVNNGAPVGNGIQAGSPGGDGTAEKPVDTVQAGATLAGANSTGSGKVWTAYVQGGGANYSGLVTTTGSTHYFGSSQPIPALGGKVFGGTSPNPVLDGAIVADAGANPAINLVSVQGFTILHGIAGDDGATAPITIFNVPNVTITNNIIQDSFTEGIHVEANSGAAVTALINNNTVTFPSDAGISLVTFNSGSSLTATVQGNTISNASSDGIAVLATGDAFGGSVVNMTITRQYDQFSRRQRDFLSGGQRWDIGYGHRERQCH